MKRLLVLGALILSAEAGLAARAGPAAARTPNVVLILADDLGWADLGSYGSRYHLTPNLDRLAAEGMRFTDAYSCGPNCTPTRAALMTGKWPVRTGIYTVATGARGRPEDRKLIPAPNRTRLQLDEVTLGQAMQRAGYATGMFGKWDLGDDGPHHPAQRGFDEAVIATGRHFDFRPDPPEPVEPGTYLADYLTAKAERFIRRHRGRPFFLFLSHFAVHSPFEAKPDLVEKHRARAGVGGQRDPVYAAMLESLDESVGRIARLLRDLRLERNTLLIFTSDNGGLGGYARAGVHGMMEPTDNAPLRGGKGMLYEGGIRVPLIVRRPRAIRAGAVNSVPTATVDLYPTLLELAGVSPLPGQALDGISLAELFRGGTPPRRDALYWHFPGYLEAGTTRNFRTRPAGAVRWGRWKLLEFFETGAVELYDLIGDSGETTELSRELPDVARKLRERLEQWRREVGTRKPEPGR